ncbi:hypothetical protein [Veronia pacifica]|uniref:Uncharacterized protein n=1 Tax=Veronia pacifica TaxID=1080227 RepID=A0A1C3EG45_9GAMM|nr:hypothetical protein [Veronia pacifica]ODA32232.1 hypothetical protein A8L45_13635 [Veronia pacifica]
MEENKLRSAAIYDAAGGNLAGRNSACLLSDENHFKPELAMKTQPTVPESAEVNLIVNFSHLFARDVEREDYLKIKRNSLRGALLTQYERDRLVTYESKIATYELDLALLILPSDEREKYLSESTELLHFEDSERFEYGEELTSNSPRFNQVMIERFSLAQLQRLKELNESIKATEENALRSLRERALCDPQLYGRLLNTACK